MHSDFSKRMKEYEGIETGRRFIPLLPIYARIDGRSFSRFTSKMLRPYEITMSMAMIATTKYMVEQTNARIGYTQSDEINLVWLADEYASETFFDGKIQKMVSVLAAMTTAKFNQICLGSKLIGMSNAPLYDAALRYVPHFDCRVFQLPNRTEAANVFLWREKDATKNAISMAARSFYPHSALQGKSGSIMQEMIFQKGQNFNDYPAFFKRGTFVQSKTTLRPFTDVERAAIREEHRPSEKALVLRSEVVALEMPSFTKVKNREAVIFDGANPELLDATTIAV